MKVIVTGGAGFIGSHIVDLLKKKHKVTVIDNYSTGRRKYENDKNVTVQKFNAQNLQPSFIADQDIIIHCAAQVSTFKSIDYPEYDFKNNCLATFNLFEMCRKYNPRALIIYTSSRSVLGNISDSFANENSPYKPQTLYNVHKIYGEYLCEIYNELYGMNFIVLRPANVYGERQPYWEKGWYNFIAYWIQLSLEDKPIPIYGNGTQTRDYVYVKDVAEAYKSCLNNKEALNDTFLLCTGIETSLNELADMIIELTDSKSEIKYLPKRKGDIHRFVGSYAYTELSLGWKPKTDLKKGLKNEIKWMKGENYV